MSSDNERVSLSLISLKKRLKDINSSMSSGSAFPNAKHLSTAEIAGIGEIRCLLILFQDLLENISE